MMIDEMKFDEWAVEFRLAYVRNSTPLLGGPGLCAHIFLLSKLKQEVSELGKTAAWQMKILASGASGSCCEG